MTIEALRNNFPALAKNIGNHRLVYFDNAATAQRPTQVLDKQRFLAEQVNGNIHRAVHSLASEATEEYETTRDAVKEFIGAESRQEIIFTSGTTESINLVAYSFGEAFIHEGDEIIVGEEEHHSNIVPWQLLCDRKGAKLKVLGVDDSGHLKVDELESLITPRTKLLAVAQVSNVLGMVNDTTKLAQISHSHGVPILVDGAQGIVHQGINVKNAMCDFYAFSGHKIYGSTGTGVLYGKNELLEKMPPFKGGGEMIATVKFSGTTFAPLPGKFEAGTQNFNSIPTLKEAIKIAKLMEDEEIVKESEAVKEYLYDALTKDERITLYGTTTNLKEKTPVFSFTVKGAHHEDLALILDKMGIAVRSGQMCAEPTMDRFGVTGMVRASLLPYNTMEEAEYFIKSLDKAIKMLA